MCTPLKLPLYWLLMTSVWSATRWQAAMSSSRVAGKVVVAPPGTSEPVHAGAPLWTNQAKLGCASSGYGAVAAVPAASAKAMR